jgi:hypothetical protein
MTIQSSNLLDQRGLRLIFLDPKIRPPVLEEMMPDINRLAASIARIRSDPTCHALTNEDLIAECHFKLATLITKNRIEQLPNRVEAFKFIKTVFNNHVKSLVSKHRMTLKRGARRANEDQDGPNETSLNQPATHFNHTNKNNDCSADDPDLHVQIADPTSGWTSENSFIADVEVYLTPIELMVLKEFNEPSERTRFYAEVDSSVGRKSGAEHVITISEKNYADGVGLELAQFKKVLRCIRSKMEWIKMNGEATDEEIKWNRAIARLEEFFEIQIPQSVEKTIVRRLLTVAAVDRFDQVEMHPTIQEDLRIIGAKIPERRAGTISCFGIMFQKNNRTCAACGLNQACRQEAMNFGLGDITLDDRLLGSKQYRVPVVVANTPEPLPIMSARDEEVYNFLCESFDVQQIGGEWHFRHKDVGRVCVTMKFSPVVVVTINRPSETIIPKLVKIGNSYTVPPTLNAGEAIGLINKHINATFNASTATV